MDFINTLVNSKIKKIGFLDQCKSFSNGISNIENTFLQHSLVQDFYDTITVTNNKPRERKKTEVALFCSFQFQSVVDCDNIDFIISHFNSYHCYLIC